MRLKGLFRCQRGQAVRRHLCSRLRKEGGTAALGEDSLLAEPLEAILCLYQSGIVRGTAQCASKWPQSKDTTESNRPSSSLTSVQLLACLRLFRRRRRRSSNLAFGRYIFDYRSPFSVFPTSLKLRGKNRLSSTKRAFANFITDNFCR